MASNKIVLAGPASAGKSSLMRRLTTDTFDECEPQTIGAAFHQARVQRHGQDVKLDLWDTAGQERFGIMNLQQLYYRGGAVAVLVFDFSLPKSFAAVQDTWLPTLRQFLDRNAVVILVANKIDLSAMPPASSRLPVNQPPPVEAAGATPSSHPDGGLAASDVDNRPAAAAKRATRPPSPVESQPGGTAAAAPHGDGDGDSQQKHAEDEEAAFLRRIREFAAVEGIEHVVLTSARTGEGCAELMNAIADAALLRIARARPVLQQNPHGSNASPTIGAEVVVGGVAGGTAGASHLPGNTGTAAGKARSVDFGGQRENQGDDQSAPQRPQRGGPCAC